MISDRSQYLYVFDYFKFYERCVAFLRTLVPLARTEVRHQITACERSAHYTAILALDLFLLAGKVLRNPDASSSINNVDTAVCRELAQRVKA